MTNYNKRLDEILMGVWHAGYNRCNMEKNHADGYDNYAFAIAPKKAKQAITSLIKELVAEAKPKQQSTENMGDTFKVNWARGHNIAIDQFEQNLLKALEEV